MPAGLAAGASGPGRPGLRPGRTAACLAPMRPTSGSTPCPADPRLHAPWASRLSTRRRPAAKAERPAGETATHPPPRTRRRHALPPWPAPCSGPLTWACHHSRPPRNKHLVLGMQGDAKLRGPHGPSSGVSHFTATPASTQRITAVAQSSEDWQRIRLEPPSRHPLPVRCNFLHRLTHRCRSAKSASAVRANSLIDRPDSLASHRSASTNSAGRRSVNWWLDVSTRHRHVTAYHGVGRASRCPTHAVAHSRAAAGGGGGGAPDPPHG